MKINGKDVRDLTPDSLAYHRKDLLETIAAQEPMERQGMSTPKLNQYRDELHAVEEEIARRQAGKKLSADVLLATIVQRLKMAPAGQTVQDLVAALPVHIVKQAGL